jgi:hypothetical protein
LGPRKGRPRGPACHRPPKRAKADPEPRLVPPRPPSSPESRLEDAKAWILAHPVPNTEAAYPTYNKQFHDLLERQGAPSMPAEPASVVNFMEELVDRGLAVGTLNSVALSAIVAEYKLVDFQSPTSSSLVRAAKLVVGRKATPPPVRARNP